MTRVKIGPAHWGSLLLLAACRQPNPEWKGAEDGAMGSDTGPAPGTSTTEPATTGPATGPATTGPAADSSGEVSTEGEPCNNDNQCPEGWVCGPMGCQLGGDGDPCGGNGDCQAPTGLCGPGGTCQGGEEGDPCSSANHCAAMLTCTNDVCSGD